MSTIGFIQTNQSTKHVANPWRTEYSQNSTIFGKLNTISPLFLSQVPAGTLSELVKFKPVDGRIVFTIPL